MGKFHHQINFTPKICSNPFHAKLCRQNSFVLFASLTSPIFCVRNLFHVVQQMKATVEEEAKQNSS